MQQICAELQSCTPGLSIAESGAWPWVGIDGHCWLKWRTCFEHRTRHSATLAVLQSLQPRDVKELRSANLIIHVRLHRPLLSGEHQNGDRACEKEDSRILAGAGQDSCLMHTNPFESNVSCFDFL